jgi:uroporphyrinogen-III decarboxylase
MEKLVDVLAAFAAQQVDGGADVIQIFDSWAGALSVQDYREFCLKPTTELVTRVRALGVPVIYFGVDTASLLPAMRETGADVIGLDWRTPLADGWKAVGPGSLRPQRCSGPASPKCCNRLLGEMGISSTWDMALCLRRQSKTSFR